MIAIKKDAMRYRDPETGEFVGVSLIGGDAPSDISGTSVKIDTTLTQSGQAADAKVVGDRLTALNDAIDAKGNPTDEQVSAAVNAYLDANPVSGGISTTAKNLLITILRSGVYTDDQSANITSLETALGGGTTEPDVPVEKTYTISNELINCTSSNSAASIKENAAYTATLTANDGYTMTGGTVTITMGGVDITVTAYADGVITIAAVTGNIEIFASAVQSETTPAELPTDRMLAYWDMRNAPIAETYSPTDGDSSLYQLKNNNTWEATETDVTPYGLCLQNTTYGGVNIQKSTDSTFADMTFGTEFTIAAYCYGAEDKANMGVTGTARNGFGLPGYAINYFDSDGTKHSVNANYLKNAHVLGEYWMHSYTVNGNMALSFHKGNEELRVEGDGSTLEGFDHWENTSFNIRSIKNYPRASLTAVVIYNRALSNAELIELYEYFRTLDVPVEKTYTISSELINCTSSNSATSVNENDPYTATLTTNDGYTLDGATVSVTMGGADITATAYADGVISIAAVTGDVEIFASAIAIQAEAALPEDGLISYFDFRTTTYDNAGSGGKTTIAPTKGSGQLYMWQNNSISAQNEYGLKAANGRPWQYDQNGGTNATALGDAFTVIQLTYGEAPGFGFKNSNVGARWLFCPQYINASGSTAYAAQVNGNNFNSDNKDDYNFAVVRADGTTLTEIFDTSRTTYNGGDIDGFSRWLDTPSGNIITQGDNKYSTAMAIYNRALTDVEIEAAREFMKTLEVTA